MTARMKFTTAWRVPIKVERRAGNGSRNTKLKPPFYFLRFKRGIHVHLKISSEKIEFTINKIQEQNFRVLNDFIGVPVSVGQLVPRTVNLPVVGISLVNDALTGAPIPRVPTPRAGADPVA